MRFKFLTVIMIIATLFLLAGCMGTNRGQEGQGTTIENTRNVADRNTNQGFTGTDMMQNVDNRTNRNGKRDRFDVSREAADRIVNEIAEIDRAFVVTTGKNAYVAAMLDDDGQMDNRNRRRTDDTATKRDRRADDGNITDRMANKSDKKGDKKKGKKDGKKRNNSGKGTDNLSTSNRQGGDGQEVTDRVKDRISNIVRNVDNRIDNVFVSTNPDFFELAANYSRDMDNGKPVQGFFDQLGNAIERIFPQNK